MIPLGLALALSYVMGSIPAAYLAGRVRGVDLRRHGSGNLGATNVLRVLGVPAGLTVFAVDVAKGAMPVLVLPALTSVPPRGLIAWGEPHVWIGVLCGVAAILGHARPVFLGFRRGGKGVATAGGVFLALAPVPTILALMVFAVALLASGYVSLGSLMAAVMLPLLLLLTTGMSPLFAVSAVVAAFVFWTHRPNIERLRRGEEHRFGKPRDASRLPAAVLAVAASVVVAVLVAVRFA